MIELRPHKLSNVTKLPQRSEKSLRAVLAQDPGGGESSLAAHETWPKFVSASGRELKASGGCLKP